ncbi:MAG: hypothetical protein V3T04_02080 [Dehalococcoidia bacterium]|jgi:malate dehydrogenase
MMDAVILDKKKTLPCAAYPEGEYGIEQIIELKLTPEEDAALRKSADAVRELVKVMNL